MSGKRRGDESTGDLFGTPTLPEGFAYAPGVISDAEERELVRRIETLDLRPFEFQGFFAKRRICTFGRSYMFAGQKPRADASIPDYLQFLTHIAAGISEADAEAFEQIMISEYAQGAGIGWHRDHPTYEDIVGFSLLAPCTLRFRQKSESGWERREALVEPRSVYLLHGPVRTQWQHGIEPMDTLRYSITLRSFRRSAEESGKPRPKRSSLTKAK